MNTYRQSYNQLRTQSGFNNQLIRGVSSGLALPGRSQIQTLSLYKNINVDDFNVQEIKAKKSFADDFFGTLKQIGNTILDIPKDIQDYTKDLAINGINDIGEVVGQGSNIVIDRVGDIFSNTISMLFRNPYAIMIIGIIVYMVFRK